jgi:hypothetical protein
MLLNSSLPRAQSLGRGNPQQLCFLQQLPEIQALPCLWVALSLRVHRQ